MEEVTGRLESWYYDEVYNWVWGYLYDDVHKRWEEGTHIHTSSIVSPISSLKEGEVIQTRNSKYLLGKPLKIVA